MRNKHVIIHPFGQAIIFGSLFSNSNPEFGPKNYRVTRRVFSKSVTSKLHLLFEKNLAGYLKTLKGTRISAMYTNFLHLPVHSGPSKFSRSKISNWSLGNTKANKKLLND